MTTAARKRHNRDFMARTDTKNLTSKLETGKSPRNQQKRRPTEQSPFLGSQIK
jgi:hypothetical protein